MPRLFPLTLLSALALAGCETELPPGDSPTDSTMPEETSRIWNGTIVDGGFGARLATDGDTVWVSAPFAAKVYANGLEQVASGAVGSFLGAGLAWTRDGLAIGAPGAGTVAVNGAVELQESGIGGVVAVGPGGWVASTPSGWVAADGSRVELGRRPDALVLDGDARAPVVVAGANFGETSLWRGGVPSPRVLGNDEAGAALLTCDTDGDGVVELVIGAPGEGKVWIEGVAYGTGAGRFGASLACGTQPGVLYVGAPGEGVEHAGIVFVLKERGAPTAVLAGRPLDELGAALTVAAGWLYAGAPGPAASPGLVRGIPEP